MNAPREEVLFHLALTQPAEERGAWLERECGEDHALRARLEALIAAHGQPETLLQTQAESVQPTIRLEYAENPHEAVGQKLGRYKLLERVGEGGCGVVYVAEQTEPVRRRVALKVIKPGMDSKAVIARFEAERQALAIMDHPNIAKVLDAGTTDSGRPYFVMELVRGVRITEYCDQAQLPTRDRIELFILVCQAIQHAHQKGIIHRDIKPSNILVTLHDGIPVPKVIDFGIAKAISGRLTSVTVYTELHQFLGTPAYMSPEQAEMSGLDIDTRSDIYSLGVLLYEILIGRPPFDPKDLIAAGIEGIRRTIREQEPERPSFKLAALQRQDLTTTALGRGTEPRRLIHLVQGDLDWIALRCLEKDRTRRYETANGLAADLRRHLQNEPVTARPPTTAYRLQKVWQRHRLAMTTGAAVGIFLLSSVLILSWALRGQSLAREASESAQAETEQQRIHAEEAHRVASEERDRAARLLSVANAERGVLMLEKSDPTGLLYLLEARRAVEHLPEDRIRRTLLWDAWMAALPKPERHLPPNARPALNPGTTTGLPWMAIGSTNGMVTLRDSGTGAEILSFHTGRRQAGSPECSANGRLLMVNAGGDTQLWDLTSIRSNQPPRLLVSRILRHAFDPSRRRIVTLANEGAPLPGLPLDPDPSHSKPNRYQLQVWDTQLDQPLLTTWADDRSDLANHQFALSPEGAIVASGWHALTLWDSRTGAPLPVQVNTNGVPGRRDFFDVPAFSPNGRWLWEVRGSLCLRYDRATGQPVGETIEGLHRWNRPWITPDGVHYVLTLDTAFLILHLDSGQRMGPPIPRHEETTTMALALSADGRRLATSGPDGSVRVWDTATGEAVIPPIVLPAVGVQASFTPDNEWLIVSSPTSPTHRHRLAPAEPALFRKWPGLRIFGFNPQGQGLTYRESDRRMQWMDLWTGIPTAPGWTLPGEGRLIEAALDPGTRVLATAIQSSDRASEIRFWESTNGNPRPLSITWTNFGHLAFSHDGQKIAGLGSGDGSIHVWDAEGGEVLSRLHWAHPMQVVWTGVHFSPDDRFLAARNSYAVTVWDRTAGRVASGSEQDFYLAISQDWNWALTDRELLDISDPTQPRPAPQPVPRLTASTDRGGLAVSPDGRLRASGLGNKSVRIWNVTTGSPVSRDLRTTGMALRMEFSPDSRLLLTLERDFGIDGRRSSLAVRVWETSTGLPCGPAVPQKDQPIGLWFDRDIRLVAFDTFHDSREAMVLKLPSRDIPLAEMEQHSWLLAGSRLDPAGNLEVLSTAALAEIESLSRASTP